MDSAARRAEPSGSAVTELKHQIKEWEHAFAKAHGHKPGKEDMKQPDIRGMYVAYTAAKSRAPEPTGAASPRTAAAPQPTCTGPPPPELAVERKGLFERRAPGPLETKRRVPGPSTIFGLGKGVAGHGGTESRPFGETQSGTRNAGLRLAAGGSHAGHVSEALSLGALAVDPLAYLARAAPQPLTLQRRECQRLRDWESLPQPSLLPGVDLFNDLFPPFEDAPPSPSPAEAPPPPPRTAGARPASVPAKSRAPPAPRGQVGTQSGGAELGSEVGGARELAVPGGKVAAAARRGGAGTDGGMEEELLLGRREFGAETGARAPVGRAGTQGGGARVARPASLLSARGPSRSGAELAANLHSPYKRGERVCVPRARTAVRIRLAEGRTAQRERDGEVGEHRFERGVRIVHYALCMLLVTVWYGAAHV
ncbi:hypothetical protein T492DRAFT_1131376 [Pavlovales sp. CCMP2436]|nr:hypothetical protein T492DRAFT_1131376 [Pavlovales sp. CCMP2436]